MTGDRSLIRAVVGACCVISTLFAFTAPVAAKDADGCAAELCLGIGRAEITPPVGTPLAGYSKRRGDPSTGIEAPLFARAIALRQGETTAVIVSAEILIITDHLYAAVTAALHERYGAAPEAVLLTATHTHAGPGAYGQRFVEQISMGRYDAAVFEQLVDGIATAVGQALHDVQPVRVGYGQATIPALVSNRRQADGVADAALHVVGFQRADGQWRAFIVNGAAHPTTLGSDNMMLSGDYPGVVMRAVEATCPGGMCVFTVSSLGDQRPVIAEKNLATLQAYGLRIAGAVSQALESWSWQEDPRLAIAAQTMPLPRARVRLGWLKLPRLLSQALLHDRSTSVTVVRLGDGLLIGYPGEPTASVGLQLQQRLAQRGWQSIVLALTHEYIGYVVSAEEYAEDSYEAKMSFFGPELAARLEEAVLHLAERVSHVPAQP